MHGKSSLVKKSPDSLLFQRLPEKFQAARYHSLSAEAATLPPDLKVTAVTDYWEVMAVEHSLYPVYGVQFHPESVMTLDGKIILENFLEAAETFQSKNTDYHIEQTERMDQNDQRGNHQTFQKTRSDL